MATSYLIPGSMSSRYVSDTKNYEKMSSELGVQRQAALQDLQKNYEQTIDNAYASYLSNQRILGNTNMLEGYKQQYQQAQEQQFAQNVAEANKNVSTARQELLQNTSAAQQQIQQAYNTEVANLDRVARSYQQYYDYVKGLTPGTELAAKEPNAAILTDEQLKLPVDDMYETLSSLQPRDYVDAKGNTALAYSEWLNQQMTESEEDQAFWQWYNAGGASDFLREVKMRTAGEKAAAEQKDLVYTNEIKDLESDIAKFVTSLDKEELSVLEGLENNELLKTLNEKYGIKSFKFDDKGKGEFKTYKDKRDYLSYLKAYLPDILKSQRRNIMLHSSAADTIFKPNSKSAIKDTTENYDPKWGSIINITRTKRK